MTLRDLTPDEERERDQKAEQVIVGLAANTEAERGFAGLAPMAGSEDYDAIVYGSRNGRGRSDGARGVSGRAGGSEGEDGQPEAIEDPLEAQVLYRLFRLRVEQEARRRFESETPAEDTADEWSHRVQGGGSFVFDVPAETPAIWGQGQQVAWAKGEALMICGPAGVGKTTVANQLVAARLGLDCLHLLGLPVRPGERKLLYLAMDRPPQIARAMARLFKPEHREVLAQRLVVWRGPPPYDLATRPETLLKLCEMADADTVVVDSLKDAAVGLTKDEVGAGYNRARQRALAAGVEVLELHHQRKANSDNKRPEKLDDVYGSVWLPAGAGSVIVLWGEAGDPVVELSHLKQPAEQLGPWRVVHDHLAGRTEVYHQTDLLRLVKIQGQVGMTARVLAQTLFDTTKPSDAQVMKARRQLEAKARQGLLVQRGQTRDGANTWFLASTEMSNRVAPPGNGGGYGEGYDPTRIQQAHDPTTGVTEPPVRGVTAGVTGVTAPGVTSPPPTKRGAGDPHPNPDIHQDQLPLVDEPRIGPADALVGSDCQHPGCVDARVPGELFCDQHKEGDQQ
jgi:replicative DNA helicase